MWLFANGNPLPAEPEDTILSAMKRAQRDIQSVCGGRGMCGTCRVAVDAAWLDRLPPPGVRETRLLAALKAGGASHRLACQTILAAAQDGLRFQPDPPPTRRTETFTQETKL